VSFIFLLLSSAAAAAAASLHHLSSPLLPTLSPAKLYLCLSLFSLDKNKNYQTLSFIPRGGNRMIVALWELLPPVDKECKINSL